MVLPVMVWAMAPTAETIATNSALYWISFAVLIVVTALVSFGGIKKITKVTDLMVPIMAVIYVLTVIVLVLVNLTRIPWFFAAVFSGAFQPEAIFGGAFGVALSQGIKRGLMTTVQEALDTTIISLVYLSSLTPITKVGVSLSLAGAEITTFLAPPLR